MTAMAYDSPSFTNRQVAKLQQRGLGLAIDEEGRISRDGAAVGQCDPQSPLFPDLKVLLSNLDRLGFDYRQGQQATSLDDLKHIAAFPEEVVLTPHPEGAAVGVKLGEGFERASFSDIDAARDVARLYEDYQQLARDLAHRRGIDIGIDVNLATERPALSAVDEAQEHRPAQQPGLEPGIEI